MTESRRRFLVVSNMRSGSTLLETMLGSLPGVHADKEIKWRPKSTTSLHIPISETTTDLASLLDQELGSTDAELVGSKLVLDPVALSQDAGARLRELITPDWFVIHLTRSYRDVYLSGCRGVGHLRNERGVPLRSSAISEAVATAVVGDEASIACKYVDRIACFRELQLYLENDLWIAGLATNRKRYLLLDYKDIFSYFRRLTAFLRLDAFAPEVDRVVDAPPLKKLPGISPDRLIANISDLEGVFQSVERLRELLLLDRAVLSEFLLSWEAYQERGTSRASEGDYSGAVSDYTAALNGAPPNPALLFLRGSAWLQIGDSVAAAKDFEAALQLDPDNAPVQSLLAQARAERA